MKDRAILSLKGIAIIGVVTHHILNRRQDPLAHEYLDLLSIAFDWCVLGFVCISGYLHALSDSRREKGVAEFVLQRFNRLIIPFVLLVFFYALVWQFLGAIHISGIAVMIPSGFVDKLTTSLWPVNQRAVVAEQLYYLPLLFGASVLFVLARRLGIVVVWATLFVAFLVGQGCFPAQFTQFRLGSFVWAICFYAAGYLMCKYRAKADHVRLTLIVATLLMAFFGGWHSLLGSIPLWLLWEGDTLKLGALPVLPQLGEASGTIYIYHTPFIVQTLSVVATHLPGWKLQVVGALGAGAASIAICYLLHYLLKDTRAKVILM